MKADILHVRSRMPAWIVWKALNKIPEQKDLNLFLQFMVFIL